MLQEALFGIFAAEKENLETLKDSLKEGHKQVKYYERQTMELVKRVQYFDDYDEKNYVKTDREHMQLFTKIFDYIRFL